MWGIFWGLKIKVYYFPRRGEIAQIRRRPFKPGHHYTLISHDLIFQPDAFDKLK
jgi:hypothetical protein